jgi:hypothetical protein
MFAMWAEVVGVFVRFRAWLLGDLALRQFELARGTVVSRLFA